MEETRMAFNSVTALEGLVNQSLGKPERLPFSTVSASAVLWFVQGVLAAAMSKLVEHIDITKFDDGLTKTLDGARQLERVIVADPVVHPAAKAPAQ